MLQIFSAFLFLWLAADCMHLSSSHAVEKGNFQLGLNSNPTVFGMILLRTAVCPGCSGDTVLIENQTFYSGTSCECVAAESITIGRGVTIRSGATVTLKAPKVNVQSEFLSEEGAVVNLQVIPHVGKGHITYNLGDDVYRVSAENGATPENISQALEILSPQPSGGEDGYLNISPDGEWLILETARFDARCAGWACLAVVKGDLSEGNAVLSGGDVVHAENGGLAIASGGELIIFTDSGGTHTRDLWVMRKTGSEWSAPVELTTTSSYTYNLRPAISPDASRVLFNCTNERYAGVTCICEVGTDGTGLKTVVTPADSPLGYPDSGDLRGPDYAPDGSIIFEADWNGERIWRLPAGASVPVIVGDYNNDNGPCVLPDGRIASLWLNRPGGPGYHELKVMSPDGSSYFMPVIDVDIWDIGLGCGN